MSHTNPLPELPEPDAHMYPSDLEKFKTCETWAQAFSVAVGNPDERSEPLFTEAKMNAHAAAAYDLGARSTAAQPADREITGDELKLITDLRWALGDNGKRMQPELVEYAREIKAMADAAAQPGEQPSTMHDTTGTQALWPQMIAALAAIDAELGLPEDGCNSLTQTLAAIRKLKAAPPAASGDSTPPSEPAGLTDDRIKRHTLRAADCPPDSKVLLVSSVRRFLAAQGDPSGALRPEPEAAGQGRWQPIETAPRGYSPPLSPINHHAPSILGLWGQAFYCVCSWGGPGKPMWIGEDNRPIPFQPTHWQPLPEPPQAASGERGD